VQRGEHRRGQPAGDPAVAYVAYVEHGRVAVVGITKTNAQGNYTAVLKNQEYPIVRANTAAGQYAAYGGTSASKVVRSTTRVVSAKFIAPVINFDTKLQA
jgi:hypothetical protein